MSATAEMTMPAPTEIPEYLMCLGATAARRCNYRFDPVTRELISCCGLTAVLIERSGHSRARELTDLSESGAAQFGTARAEELGISLEFSWGAQDGWDGELSPDLGPDYAEGYRWGREAWSACVRSGFVAVLDALDDSADRLLSDDQQFGEASYLDSQFVA